tara:strand:+ start:2279 stop:3055 length:777 start_codon:yes stop_codon:yes gene_type:complete
MTETIGIIGKGVLGTSIFNFFELKINVLVYDKYKNIGNFDNILNTDILFLCLPSLFKEEIKEYDIDEIKETCNLLRENKYKGIIILKSTVLPGTTEMLNKEYGLNIIHNPEFLSEKTATDDFKNQKHIVLGGEELDKCINFFKRYFPDIEYSYLTSKESELMKIAVNNFYSTKIMFFNELFILSQNINTSYEKVKEAMLKNKWINPMHTKVPGNNNKLGFGGMCFPKDTSAYYNYLKKNSEYYEIAKATVEQNKTIRK